MKGFALDRTGDIVLKNKDIALVTGEALTLQTLGTVLGTNRGEWFLDWEEGIDFSSLLGKYPGDEAVEQALYQGLQQVEKDLQLESLQVKQEQESRRLEVRFTARNSNGQKVEGVKQWA